MHMHTKSRAAISNDVSSLPDIDAKPGPRNKAGQVDGRSALARRYRDLVNGYVADLGGIEMVSAVKLGLVRQLAAVTLQAEQLAARAVTGEPVDLSKLASTAIRLSSPLGLERQARDVTNLQSYLHEKYGSQPEV